MTTTFQAQQSRALSCARLVVEGAEIDLTPGERVEWIVRLAANLRQLSLTEICAELLDWADMREAEALAHSRAIGDCGDSLLGRNVALAVAASARRMGSGE